MKGKLYTCILKNKWVKKRLEILQWEDYHAIEEKGTVGEGEGGEGRGWCSSSPRHFIYKTTQ